MSMLKILGQSYFHMYISFIICFNENFDIGHISNMKRILLLYVTQFIIFTIFVVCASIHLFFALLKSIYRFHFLSMNKILKLLVLNFYSSNSFEIYRDGIVGYRESTYKFSSHSEKFYILY